MVSDPQYLWLWCQILSLFGCGLRSSVSLVVVSDPQSLWLWSQILSLFGCGLRSSVSLVVVSDPQSLWLWCQILTLFGCGLRSSRSLMRGAANSSRRIDRGRCSYTPSTPYSPSYTTRRELSIITASLRYGLPIYVALVPRKTKHNAKY